MIAQAGNEGTNSGRGCPFTHNDRALEANPGLFTSYKKHSLDELHPAFKPRPQNVEKVLLTNV